MRKAKKTFLMPRFSKPKFVFSNPELSETLVTLSSFGYHLSQICLQGDTGEEV